MAKAEGVNTHKRALEYADDKTKTFNEVVEHIASSVSGDILMWTPCVCPLVTSDTYSLAIAKYNEYVLDKKINDSLISVRLFKEYLWNDKEPINYKLGVTHVLSQNLPDWYIVTNGIYMAQRDLMINNKYFMGKNPYKFLVSKKEAVDIDDAEDSLREFILTKLVGDSLVIAAIEGEDKYGNPENFIKVHFHTNEPWLLLAKGQEMGDIYDIVVENMQRQADGLKG
jgi:N-acylneuraminate cytidylyltransferase